MNKYFRYNRAEVIRSLRWKLGRVLPEEIVKKLSNSEKEYFKAYSGALDSYMDDMNLELTVVSSDHSQDFHTSSCEIRPFLQAFWTFKSFQLSLGHGAT